MNDIERAMAQLKVTVAAGLGQSQSPEKNDGQLDIDRTASEKLPDIDVGWIDADCDPVMSNTGGTSSASTSPANGESYVAASGHSRHQPIKKFKSYRSHDLPLLALGKAGFITPDTLRSKITEEYRRIKRPLLKRLAILHEDDKVGRNVIAVTSATAGEGKTFSAVNLAMSLAREKDRTVLLIDADVAKHTTGKLFGVSSEEPGLLDLLDSDTMDQSDVVLTTNVERLNFLPAGRNHELASELLSSENMSLLIADLSSQHEERIIVMDCPPIMQTNEAAILVDHAGQIVFVVAEEQASQGMIIQALRLIGNEAKVGILLNKSTIRLGHYDNYSYAYS